MNSGVYIGTQPSGSYGLISTGDYIHPLSFAFRLKDTGSSIEKTQKLYAVINNINIEFYKIQFTGKMLGVRPFFSFDNETWTKELSSYENIDATMTTIVKPFYVKFIVDDMIDYFASNDISRTTTFKMKVTFG